MAPDVYRLTAMAAFDPGRYQKVDVVGSDRLQLGLNCLEPGQSQPVHGHAGQDKFYLVLSGTAQIRLGEEAVTAVAGELAWAPAGLAHGVNNPGPERLVLLVGMAPAPGR